MVKFISTATWCAGARLYLSVRAALPTTLAAGEHVRLRPSHPGQLMLSDGLLGQYFSDLLQFCTRHFLQTHTDIWHVRVSQQ